VYIFLVLINWLARTDRIKINFIFGMKRGAEPHFYAFAPTICLNYFRWQMAAAERMLRVFFAQAD
jgi:hypothetical protein